MFATCRKILVLAEDTLWSTTMTVLRAGARSSFMAAVKAMGTGSARKRSVSTFVSLTRRKNRGTLPTRLRVVSFEDIYYWITSCFSKNLSFKFEYPYVSHYSFGDCRVTVHRVDMWLCFLIDLDVNPCTHSGKIWVLQTSAWVKLYTKYDIKILVFISLFDNVLYFYCIQSTTYIFLL